jgi:hypothetical protein
VKEDDGGCQREAMDVEEQLRRSEVDSSYASGGQASARAMVEGMDGAVSDSDDSDGGQLDRHMVMQQVSKSKGYKKVLGLEGDKAGEGSGVVRVIPSMGAEAMVTGDNRVLTSSCEVLGTNPMVGLAASGQVAIVEEHVTNSCSVLPNPGLLEDGPDRAGLVCGANGPIGAASISLGGVNEEIAEVGLQKAFDPNPYLNGGTAGMQLGKGQMIDNFDLLVQKTRGSQCAESFHSLPANQPSTGDVHPPHIKTKKNRRVTATFPSLLGPKCLRFAEVIGNSVLLQKKRRMSELASQSSESLIQSPGDIVTLSVGGDLADSVVEIGEELPVEVERQLEVQEMELTVCLSFHKEPSTNSGICFLLNEDFLKDVDGFIEARSSTKVIELEADKLLEKQQELGVNFNLEEDVPVVRMVKMEARDRSKMQSNQESNGVQ